MKNQKGITLVALVITIIVLLILAGVSISLVVGNNGILGKATHAVDENAKASALQEVKLGVADCLVNYYAAYATNSSVKPYSYYLKDTIEDSVSSGTISMTAPSETDTTFDIEYTPKGSTAVAYTFTVTVASGEVVEKP